MIRVHADSSRDRALIVKAIGGAGRVVHGVGPFGSDDTRVECVIMGSRHPISVERLALVREFERNMPWVPVIVVTDDVAAVALWLPEMGVSEIVRYEDIQAELQSRIEAVCRTAALHSLAEEFQQSTLTPALRAALTHGLRAATDRPVRSVGELAVAVGCAPVTLSQAFRRHVNGHVTLRQFLGALVILRAHQLRTSGFNWDTVCRNVGFTRPTLHSKSKQWPGQMLGQLARTPRQELLARFVSDHVHPLLDGRGSSRPPPAG
jgi:hypothetical protein